MYKTRDLVLTGESFAGKYLSYSTRAILEYNAESSNSFTFPIQSLTLYNPLVDTPTERLHQVELPYAIGLFDEFQIDQVEVLRRRCEEAVSRGWGPDDQAAACKNILNYATE